MCVDKGSSFINIQCFKLGLTLVRPISRYSLTLHATSQLNAHSSMLDVYLLAEPGHSVNIKPTKHTWWHLSQYWYACRLL